MTARQRAEANESKQAGGPPAIESIRPKSRATAEKTQSIVQDEQHQQQLMGSIHSNSVPKGKKSGSIAVMSNSKGNLHEDSKHHQAK